MKSFGALNPLLRRVARWFPADHFARKAARRVWAAWLERTDSDIVVNLQGHDLWLSRHWRSLDSTYEDEALGGFLDVIEPGDVVWDVGGHVGIYAILSALRGAEVLTWEPAPETFAQLKRHLRANAVETKCRAIQEAVSDGSLSVLEFEVDGVTAHAGYNRVLGRNAGPVKGKKISVPCRTLDQWLSETASVPDLMKMDIEGAELHAFKGGRRLLSGEMGKQPKILLSLHPAFISQHGLDFHDLDKLARELGYEAITLTGDFTSLDNFQEYWLAPRAEAAAFAQRLKQRRRKAA